MMKMLQLRMVASFSKKAGIITGLSSITALSVLLLTAANAEKILDNPAIAMAQKKMELAYTNALRNEYEIPGGDDTILIKVLEHTDTQYASILLNNIEVMKFRSAYDDMSPALRAKRTANRLYEFLNAGGDARLIKPGLEEDRVVIRIGPEVLATIDPVTAKLSQNDRKHLALVWTNLARKALGADPILRGPTPVSRSMVNREDFIDPAAFKPNGQILTGYASWYGPGFHGRTAADGSRYNMDEMTAAHKSLPFGTLVRVTNKRNGQSCVVRITDRGPYVHGRIIDLSRAAAKAIGMLGSGVAPVSVAILQKDPNFKIALPVLKEPEPEIAETAPRLKESARDEKGGGDFKGLFSELEAEIEFEETLTETPASKPEAASKTKTIPASDEVILAPAVEDTDDVDKPSAPTKDKKPQEPKEPADLDPVTLVPDEKPVAVR